MPDSFRSVLIANRGEIAVRIIRACRAAGLRSIAVYSDADARSMHVRLADEAHRIGPPAAAESYLNQDAVLEVARQSGAQALHPGYGFLAENADFAERVEQAGLAWIGPPPAAMRLLGDKAAAKSLAQQVGVPTLPGYHGQAQDDATLRAEVERIGYPLLVKATAGGGGRGMREVRDPAELDEALAAARREALAAFGSDRLLLERLLERPRHVEMQIFGDQHGTVLWLGERDCSIQRRHQKIVEEAPAPNFSPEQRLAMGQAAVALARAAGYTNAGTVEFLLDAAGRFYFLEVNTRLQVEHPVTEAVTGLDLVQLQFEVAAGEPLPLTQEEVRIEGHAIEARLYAEDPANGFMPSSGRLTRLRLPASDEPVARVRIDSGVEAGDFVPPDYDPLLAKVIAHGPSRPPAIDAMLSALDTVAVEGIRTNVTFLKHLVWSDQFGSGHLHTGLVSELGLDRGPFLPPCEILSAVAASLLLDAVSRIELPEVDRSAARLWRSGGPWRLGGVGTEVRLEYDNLLVALEVERPLTPDEPWAFRVGGTSWQAKVRLGAGPQVLVQVGEGFEPIEVIPAQGSLEVTRGRVQTNLRLASGLDPTSQARSGEDTSGAAALAPMPGRIARIAVQPGDRVTLNQTLVILEAMKIEHLVGAPRGGVVKAVRYEEGDQVEAGAILVELEA